MKSLNLDYLRTFLDVLELGSFSAAAERLSLTQPAVSLQIRQLEQRLGVRLIERIGRRAQPTAAGAALAGYASEIDALSARAIEEVARHAKGVAGRVRIGTGATACIFLLPPILRDLRRKFPALQITVSTGNTADIVKAVDENSIDVALVTLPAAGRMLEITPVLDDEFVVIAPRTMQLPQRLTPQALAALPILLFEPGGNTRRISDDWFRQSGIALKPVMSLGSVEAIKELVRAGLGCAVLPGMAVQQAKHRKELIVRPLTPKLHRTLALVIRRDKPLHRGLKDVVLALKNVARPAHAK
ncbi:LysR family transcriptional regulator [Afipia sp. P52-10]|jgi:DNA-binding transcriptional LysR family regulator|uniref:LysR family transcriptional regulator n=1 Tax=Afipia sp. P52-10 TaxID=1429916 RepID=UPI0003DEFBB7|nr:LysR family transcriptional regulator [Afipia sp. P52-10]ETR77128.1 LysR family transcriptional regulator [Afipia sp. P52-10]